MVWKKNLFYGSVLRMEIFSGLENLGNVDFPTAHVIARYQKANLLKSQQP
jgi:hypothetical protein